MSDFEIKNEVVILSNEIFLQQALNGGKNSIPEADANNNLNRNKISKYDELIKYAKTLLEQNKDIKSSLCAALKSASNDLTEIAKIVAATLIPLAIGNNTSIQLDSYIFAGISVVVFNAGINTLCNEKKENNNE